MSCLLNESQRRSLRVKVASDLHESAKNTDPFDIKDYIVKVYSEIKGITNNEPLSLDAAILVPVLASQIIAVDAELKATMRTKGLTLGQLDDLEVSFNNVDTVREYLGLTESPAPMLQAVQEQIEKPVEQVTEVLPESKSTNVAFRSFNKKTPTPIEIRNLKIQQIVDSSLRDQIASDGIADSSEMKYPGLDGGIFLAIVSDKQGYAGLTMIMVDKAGMAIKFNDDGTIGPDGKNAFYNVLSDPLTDEAGNVITTRDEFNKRLAEKNITGKGQGVYTTLFELVQEQVKASLDSKNPTNKKLDLEEYAAARKEAVAEVNKQYALLRKMRDYLNTNPGSFIKSVINNSSKGFVFHNAWKPTALSNITFSNGFTPIMTKLEGSGYKKGVVYFNYPGIDETLVANGDNFINKPQVLNTILSLFTEDLHTNIAGNVVPMDAAQRSTLLDQFLYTSDVKFLAADTGGGVKKWINSDGSYSIMVGDQKYKIKFDASPESKAMQQKAADAIKAHLTKPFIQADPNGYPIDKTLNTISTVKEAQSQGATLVFELSKATPGSIYAQQRGLDQRGNPAYDYFRVYFPVINAYNPAINTKYQAVTFEQADGKMIAKTEDKSYNEFMINNFLTTARAEAGKIKQENPYLGFAIAPSQIVKLVAPEKKSVKPINEEYRGKIIYATPGSGKSTLAGNHEDVIDTDELLLAEIAKQHPDFPIDKTISAGQNIYPFFIWAKSKGRDPEQIYPAVSGQMKELAAAGKTVLTGSARYMGIVDYAFLQKNPDILKNRPGFNTEKELINAGDFTGTGNRTYINDYMDEVLSKTSSEVSEKRVMSFLEEKKAELAEAKAALDKEIRVAQNLKFDNKSKTIAAAHAKYDSRITKLRAEIEAIQGNANSPVTQSGPADQSVDDIKAALKKKNKFLEKSAVQQAASERATEKQLAEAEEWYKNSPLAKHFPFKTVFAAVNTSFGGPAAQWAVHGVTLFHYYNENGKVDSTKSGDFSDLYHEAWHGFTQTFLTKAERESMYSEVRKNPGTFVDYKGNYVTFKDASAWQLEEYLAEDFRSYMMRGGKPQGKSPVKNSIFRRMLDFLKGLFTGASTTDVIQNPMAFDKVHAMYEKLRIGDLSNYNFDVNNRDETIGMLNKAMLARDPSEAMQELGHEDAGVLVSTIDSIISNVANEFNESEGIHSFTSQLMRDKEDVQMVYTLVKKKFTDELLPNMRAKLAEAKDEFEKEQIQENIKLLEYAINNFGDINNISNNRDGKGLIAYHQMKSKYISTEDREMFFDDINEVDQVIKAAEKFDRSGNEQSQLDMASPQVHYLLRSIHKFDEKGQPVMNKLGVQELTDYHEVWNKLARVLGGTMQKPQMYNKLLEAKSDPVIAEIISKLGPPKTTTTAETEMWIKFWSAFNLAEIRLIQMNIEKVKTKAGVEIDSYNVKIGSANTQSRKVGAIWKNAFRTVNSEFIKRNRSEQDEEHYNMNYLDLPGIINKFTDPVTGKFRVGSQFDFLRAIGIRLSDKPQIKKAISPEGGNTGAAPQIFNKIKRLVNERGLTKVYSLDDVFNEYPSDGKLEELPSDNKRYSDLRELETKHADYASNYMVTNAEGNTQFEQSLHNSISIMMSTLNEVGSYAELMRLPYMQHLNVDVNPFAKASIWLNSLFDIDNYVAGSDVKTGKKRTKSSEPGAPNVEINMTNLSGVQLIDDNGDQGVASAKADEFTKLILDFHLSTVAGRPELMRHADKGTSFSVWLSDIVGGSKDKKSYVDTISFVERKLDNGSTVVNGYGSATKLLMPYVDAELKRINKLRELSKQKDLVYDANYLNEGQKFVIFEGVLSQGVQDRLLAFDSLGDAMMGDPEISADIQKEMADYFENQTTDVKSLMGKAEFISDSLINSTYIKANNSGYSAPKASTKDALIRSFVVNSWIHNLESMSMIYGDIAQYNMKKEEFHKRNAGAGSTGSLFASDVDTLNYVSNKGRLYARSQGIKEKALDSSGSYDTAILADNEIPSTYHPQILESIKKDLERKYKIADIKDAAEKTKMQAEIDKKATKAAKAYTENNEGDAQGWITFDFYRALCMLEGKWSPHQEKMYKDMIAGVAIDHATMIEFFPTKKFQYWGPLQMGEGQMPLNAFHKFSLFPMIPSVIKGTNLEKLHTKMMDQGIDYALFKSGSKIATLTKIEDGKAIQDKFYSDGVKHTFEDKGTFTKNTVFLQFLKDQLEIAPYYKNQVTFPTQMRKLIENGLMEGGIPTDFQTDKSLVEREKAWNKLTPNQKLADSPRYKLVKEYEQDIADLTALRKKELVKEADIKFDAQGNIIFTEQLRNFLIKELNRQDLGEHEISFIKVGPNGKIAHDFSISLSAEKLEKILNSIVVRRLVKQKFNGEGLIQVSGAGFESVSDTSDISKAKVIFGHPTIGKSYLKERGDNRFITLDDDYANEVNAFINANRGTETRQEYKGRKPKEYNEFMLNLFDRVKALAKEQGKILFVSNTNILKERMAEFDKVITMPKEEFKKRFDARGATYGFEDWKSDIDATIAKVDPSKVITTDKYLSDIMPSILRGKLTQEEQSKYGTNGLPFYEEGKGRNGGTSAMKVKIALQGDFLNLLYLNHNDGQPIETRERLNEMLKDEKWLDADNHRKMISIIGPRIPVQGLNSMEFAEVFEFLPAEAGNIVVLPTEIVAKAGSDFDIDKLTFLMPNISSGVNYDYWTSAHGKAKLAKLQEEYDGIDLSIENVSKTIENRKSEDKTTEDKAILSLLAQNSIKNVKYATDRSAEGIENSILDKMRGILELKHNFVDLVRPNDTDIVKPIADDLSSDVMESDPRTVTYDGTKKRIPGSRVFEVRYNLYKHASNNIGKQTLGLGAVDNTYNSIFNRVGARMNHQYPVIDKQGRFVINKRLDILLPHNKLQDKEGKDVISLSHLLDAEGLTSISDVISQLMNGWVDIAKDAWIFNLQGNKEIAPTLLFMVQAGVPIKQAVYMVSNPMVRAYVNEQKLAKSTFAGPLGKSPGNPMFARNQARKEILTNPKYGHLFNGNPLDLKTLNSATGTAAPYLNNYTMSLIAKNNTGFEDGSAIDFFNPEKVESNLRERVTAFKKDGTAFKYTDNDRAVFMHFIELEEMAKSIRDIKLKTNFDTSRSNTLFEAQNKIELLEELKKDGKLPEGLIDDIINESPIGSFYVQEFQIGLWKDLFKLRNDPSLNQFILTKMKEPGFTDYVEETWGDAEKMINQFRNDLVPFVFQNYLRDFDLDGMTSYKGVTANTSYKLENTPSLKHGVFSRNVGGEITFYVDKIQLKKDFVQLNSKGGTQRNSMLLSDGTVVELASLNAAAFPTANTYYSFVFERELLRSMYEGKAGLSVLKERADVQAKIDEYTREMADKTPAQIETLVYEETIRDMALDNTFNTWKLFKSRESMADQLTQLQVMYPELATTYGLVNNLSASISDRTGGNNRVANIMLTDMMLDADKVNAFHQNLRELSNPNKIKLNTTNAQEKMRVAQFFEKLSVYAFLQSGLNTTGMFSLVRIVPQERFTGLMTPMIAKFGQQMNNLTLERYWKKFRQVNASGQRRLRSRFRDYTLDRFNPAADKGASAGMTMAQVTKMTGGEITELDRFTRDNSGNLLYFANPGYTFEGQNVSGLTRSSAADLVDNNPQVAFVTNGTTESIAGADKNEAALVGTKAERGNVIPLPVKKSFSIKPDSKFQDVSIGVAQVTEMVEKEEKTFVDAFKYFGTYYDIQVVKGVATLVKGYKGKADAMNKILAAYATDPNVDPQNGKRFRGMDEEDLARAKRYQESLEAPKHEMMFNDGTKINVAFQLNGEQRDALLAMEEFYNNPEKHESQMTLLGYAGTGKTTILGIFDKYLRSKYGGQKKHASVFYSSPTHRANAVTKLKNPNAKVLTLHSLFGLGGDFKLEDGNYTLEKLEFAAKNKPKIGSNDILIVDEASMVNKALYGFLEKFKTKFNLKIIYVGDPAQLQPVKEAGISKVFEKGTQIQLTKVERTGDNPILEESTNLRNGQDFNYQTKIMGKEGVQYTNDASETPKIIKENFGGEEFKENKLYFRILAATNQVVQQANVATRKLLFGEQADEQLVKGDILMGYNNFDVDYETKEPMIINSGDYEVLSTTPSSKKVNLGDKSVEFAGYRVNLRNLLNPEDGTKSVFIVDNNEPTSKSMDFVNEISRLNIMGVEQMKRGNKRGAAQAFADAKNLDSQLAFMKELRDANGNLKVKKTLDYGYAHTIHKSQGGTYNKILILADTITESGFSKPEQQQLKYVAMSRASEFVYVRTSHTLAEPIIEAPKPLAPVAAIAQNIEQAKAIAVEGAPKVAKPITADNIPAINGNTIAPEIKRLIDTTIQSMKDFQNSGHELAFPATGLGQGMIGADELTGELPENYKMVAPATFIYLSQQLYNNFNYVNPNFETVMYGENISSQIQEEAEVSNEEVKDALSFCFSLK